MKQKFIKWVMPKDGAMPYILVELSHKNEKKDYKSGFIQGMAGTPKRAT